MEKQTVVRETLLKEFANCSDKLFTSGIIRTDSFTGEIGEFIASKYFKLNLASNPQKHTMQYVLKAINIKLNLKLYLTIISLIIFLI